MSKNKKFRTLSLATLPKVSAALETEVVEVPEFGEESTVNVRPLTVHYHALLGMYLNAMGYDPESFRGKDAHGLPSSATAAYSSINAALSSYDDDGNLVFGETPEEAVRLVLSLPAQYAPAISRISAVGTRLSNTQNPRRAVEDAEKN
ncbi:MAG: hypothetical protein KDK05_00560 [Candidatus Competibacteraceae bacterium]|nr:hypothetical protein [Anaerolineales bacterium]MCB1713609.1 hypothetical protein [Candidatus Competibacteraceae bacterium]